MTPEQWARVKEIFHAALERKGEDRETFLAVECRGEAEVRAEVDSLLTAHDDASGEEPTEPGMQGKRIGPYRIVARIGAGGMGEVFRAHDERLGREVALKILLPHLSHDADFVRRFEREARAVSALEHPNICRLYDIGEWHGRPYLTMEFLQGRTLRDRLTEGRPPIDEFLEIGIQLADALQEAHQKGFLHRDIKPSNIFLTTSGHVKVMDFGLAKCMTEELDTDIRTNPHLTPGTPAYMSPEQVKGEVLDPRTDLFSAGVVMYQMATGKLPFGTGAAALVFDRILHKEPDPPSQSGAVIPQELGGILHRALEKDRELRFQSASDLKAALKRVRRETESGRQEVVAAPKRKPLQAWLSDWRAWAGVLVLVGSVVGARWWWQSSRALEAPRIVPFTTFAGDKDSPVFSPVSDQIAFSWRGEKDDNADIYVKLMEVGTPLRLTTNPAPDVNPVWSPDGRYIAFLRNGGPALPTEDRAYFIVPAFPGPERKVADAYQPPVQVGGRNLDWSPDGQWIAIADRPSADAPLAIYLVNPSTGAKKVLRTGQAFLSQPAFSPDGKYLAYVEGPSFLLHDLYVLPITGGDGKPRRLTFDNRWIGGMAWTPDGKSLVFSSSRGGLFALWRVPSAGGRLEPVSAVGPDSISPSISRDGKRLAFVSRKLNVNLWRSRLDGTGEAEKVVVSMRTSTQPSFSPDGKRIVFASDRSGSWEIWTSDADGGNAIKLTSMGGPQTGSPRWSPDGKTIVFDSRPDVTAALFTVSAEGGPVKRLTGDNFDAYLPNWSRDGKWIYFTSNRDGATRRWRMSSEGGAPARITEMRTVFGEETADGRTLFFASNRVLYRQDLSNGKPEKVLDYLDWREFVPVDDGMYFIERTAQPMQDLEYLDLSTRERRKVTRIGPRASHLGTMAISPDRKWVLYDRTDQATVEIMLVENFR